MVTTRVPAVAQGRSRGAGRAWRAVFIFLLSLLLIETTVKGKKTRPSNVFFSRFFSLCSSSFLLDLFFFPEKRGRERKKREGDRAFPSFFPFFLSQSTMSEWSDLIASLAGLGLGGGEGERGGGGAAASAALTPPPEGAPSSFSPRPRSSMPSMVLESAAVPPPASSLAPLFDLGSFQGAELVRVVSLTRTEEMERKRRERERKELRERKKQKREMQTSKKEEVRKKRLFFFLVPARNRN